METQELITAKEDSLDIIGGCQNFEVETKDDYIKAGDIVKLLKNKIKDVEKKRKVWTKPLDEAKKAIMNDVNDIINPMKEAEKLIKDKMILFSEYEEARIAQEQKKIEAEAVEKMKETGETEMVVPVLEQEKTNRGQMGTSTMKEVWAFELEDIKLVPVEYLVLDEVKVRAKIKEKVFNIPGLKIFKKKSLSIR